MQLRTVARIPWEWGAPWRTRGHVPPPPARGAKGPALKRSMRVPCSAHLTILSRRVVVLETTRILAQKRTASATSLRQRRYLTRADAQSGLACDPRARSRPARCEKRSDCPICCSAAGNSRGWRGLLCLIRSERAQTDVHFRNAARAPMDLTKLMRARGRPFEGLPDPFGAQRELSFRWGHSSLATAHVPFPRMPSGDPLLRSARGVGPACCTSLPSRGGSEPCILKVPDPRDEAGVRDDSTSGSRRASLP
jgi:hypothetical protein